MNLAFFDSWTTASAEVAGLMWSDGCVTSRMDSILVSLKADDAELLVAMRDAMLSTHPVKFCTFWDKKYKVYREKAVLLIGSGRLCEQLNSLGCTPRKSLTLQWPQSLPEALYAPFIYGVFLGVLQLTLNNVVIDPSR